MLHLDLRQPPGLERGIRGLEAAFRVAVQLLGRGVGGGEGEGVESVLDAACVERGGFVGRVGGRGGGVELGQVERPFRFLGCGFGVGAFRGGTLRFLFGGEEGVAFGFLLRS